MSNFFRYWVDTVRSKIVRRIFISFALVCLCFLSGRAAQFDIPAPPGSGSFGSRVYFLPNGNIVVTDPTYDLTEPKPVADVGAVYVYDGVTRSLISKLTGSSQNDQVGNGVVKILPNGDFIVVSTLWNLDPTITGVGAVTVCSGSAGFNKVVSATNSLVGSHLNDNIGNLGIVLLQDGKFLVLSSFWDGFKGAITWVDSAVELNGVVSADNSVVDAGGTQIRVVKLTNGNYVIDNFGWNGNRGAVRLCRWENGCTGLMSAVNSLVGTASFDRVGFDGITALSNGNYTVASASWNANRGAVTWGDGENGITGEISASNSLIGNTSNDYVGIVTALINGNYVVDSPEWHSGTTSYVGAATFGNGTTGTFGPVSAANSLVGNASSDFSSSKIIALSNGNYVVSNPGWSLVSPPTPNVGAATWANGVTGITGTISPSNSLVGDTVNEGVGDGVVPLTNGNYVVTTRGWNSSRGAVTFGNGVSGIVGQVTSLNSLVGGNSNDSVGSSGVTALANGNYLVGSSTWNSQRGAATLADGTNGTTGVVSAANSLVGSASLDRVGSVAMALPNGNYIVRSPDWHNSAGAVTWGDGINGVTGSVSSANSLIGSSNDSVGSNGIVALPNGNYVVTTGYWHGVGAVTWGDGARGTVGLVSAENSLIGTTSDDEVGVAPFNNLNDVTPLSDGNYIVRSSKWDNRSVVDAGAVSLSMDGAPLIGQVNYSNSVLGTVAMSGSRLVFDYYPQRKQIVVGGPGNIVTLFPVDLATAFDYDGDHKSDISVFRPSSGAWYLQRSQAGLFGMLFGFGDDKIAPADYDGDGKTDIAVYRPSTGVWYVVNSSNGTFSYHVFGLAEDLPTPADYDGDGKADICVFRPSTGTWYRQNSSNGEFFAIQFGTSEDKPAVGDFDKDGKADISVFRPSTGAWYRINSSDNSIYGELFGVGSDVLAPADFDGDGKTDLAVYRPSTGIWYLHNSADGSYSYDIFGLADDIPAPGDFDGDGKADVCVFRPSDGIWYRQNSSNGQFVAFAFGTNGDKPTQTAFRY
jgi:hypothetical protein